MNQNQSDLLPVQVGCGVHAREGWHNFDKSPTLLLSKVPGLTRILKLPAWGKMARYGDIVSGLPISNGVSQRIYADQVFEHLTREGFCAALKNVFRYLAPGGGGPVLHPAPSRDGG